MLPTDVLHNEEKGGSLKHFLFHKFQGISLHCISNI